METQTAKKMDNDAETRAIMLGCIGKWKVLKDNVQILKEPVRGFD